MYCGPAIQPPANEKKPRDASFSNAKRSQKDSKRSRSAAPKTAPKRKKGPEALFSWSRLAPARPAQRAPGAGGALVSHRVAPAVPSALAGLTSGFGMGPGVPPPPWPPAPGGRCGAVGGRVRGPRPRGRPGGRTARLESFEVLAGLWGPLNGSEGLGRLVALG